jgi:hypothetical protein
MFSAVIVPDITTFMRYVLVTSMVLCRVNTPNGDTIRKKTVEPFVVIVNVPVPVGTPEEVKSI